MRRIGSGFVRSNDVVRAMVASGASVTVVPMRARSLSAASDPGRMPDTVEAMHDLSLLTSPPRSGEAFTTSSGSRAPQFGSAVGILAESEDVIPPYLLGSPSSHPDDPWIRTSGVKRYCQSDERALDEDGFMNPSTDRCGRPRDRREMSAARLT